MSLFIMDYTSKMIIFSLKKLLECFFFREKLYFFLVHLLFKNYSGVSFSFYYVFTIVWERGANRIPKKFKKQFC